MFRFITSMNYQKVECRDVTYELQIDSQVQSPVIVHSSNIYRYLKMTGHTSSFPFFSKVDIWGGGA